MEIIKTITVPQHMLEQAWQNYVNFHYGLECDELNARFCNFIDPKDENPCVMKYWGSASYLDFEALPDVAIKIRLLAGPNYYTVLKAHYANHPWK